MTSLADGNWRLIREESRPGPMQMALDEVAAETAATGGPRTVRVYRWEPSTLSLGYQQDASTVDWSYCEREGITVTRRQTGGGGIYHDREGDLSYSIVAPAAELPGSLLESYELLCQPILAALDQMGVDAAFADAKQPAIYQPACYLRGIHPAHDVLANGRKVSGNAQYRQRDAVVQHGSLSYTLAVNHHLGVFQTTGVTNAQFRDRVTAIREESNTTRSRAVEILEDSLRTWADTQADDWTEAELARAREIADAKYRAEEWNRSRVDPLPSE